jgi:hypothetical protein
MLFAFLIQTLFGLAASLACVQIVWTTLRRTSFSIAAIDKIFAVDSNLTAFWNLKLLFSAKLALLVAVVAW